MKRSLSRRSRWVLVVLWLVAGGALALLGKPHVVEWIETARLGGIEFADTRQLWWLALAWFVPPLALFSLTDLPGPQQFLQVLIRMALIASLALALAGPRQRQSSAKSLQVIHVVDRSESVSDAMLEAAQTAIFETARELEHRASSRVDVVRFDREAQRLAWPSTASADSGLDDELPPDLSRSPNSAGGTDLEAALNLALGVVDHESVAHVVVWSDGVETRGDALSLSQSFRDAGVRVYTPQLSDDATALPAEMVVEGLIAPDRPRLNIPFPVAVDVRTNMPALVSCRLTAASVQVASVQQKLAVGVTRIALGNVRLKRRGSQQLAVRCRVTQGRDRFTTNNRLQRRLQVQAPAKILYLEGAHGQGRYLSRALSGDFDVEQRDASGLPSSQKAMKAYHAIILSDVARVSPAGVPQVSAGDMHNLHRYVQQGGGLLVIGGEDSLGSGGYQGSYLDKHVLPVRMEVESQIKAPSIAMVLCIDRSGSMSGAKIELAKEAASATAEALGAEDRIGVIQFDNIARPLVRLQRAGNRYRIATNISKLTAGGGTHIFPALQQAFSMLNAAQARVKHVILLSDGQAPRAGIDALVRSMRSSGITVSTVGVGAEVDRGLIESIADRGGGRFYFTDRPETLPRIFVRETRQVAGDSVVERRVKPKRGQAIGRIDLLRGVNLGQAPWLLGYLPTRAKQGAETILQTTTNRPLLVRWRLGLGKVSVWTSDLKNRWAHHWMDWHGYARLSRQIVRDLMQEQVGSQVAVQLIREGDRLRIAVDAIDEEDRYLRALVATGAVTMPDASKRGVELKEVAVGRYEALVAMDQLGPYHVAVSMRAAVDRPVMMRGAATAVHPYPDEHRLVTSPSTVLSRLVKSTGGEVNSKRSQWLDVHGQHHLRWAWLWPNLVYLALALLLLDVGLRRIRLGPAGARGWYGQRHR